MMIIECINCKVKYNIDETKIAPPGKKVKCSKCGELFFVENKPEADETTSQVTSTLKPQEKAATSQTDTDLSTTPLNISDDKEMQKDARVDNPDSKNSDDIQPDIDFTQEPETQKTETNEKAGSDEATLKTDSIEDKESPEKLSKSENSSDLDEKLASSGAPELENSFEEVANEESISESKPENTDEGDDLKLNEEYLVDWENLEIDDTEENTEPRNRKTLTDSNAEIPEGDLELDSSRKKIKEDRRNREEQNPFRSATLAPDVSDTYSSYNRVSEAVQNKDSGMQVGSTEAKDQQIYSSEASKLNKKKGFLSSFFTNLAIFVVMVILFTAVLFSLVTFGIIPKEQYNKYLSYVSKYLPAIQGKDNKRLNKLSVKDVSGKWINTRNGFLFVVYGEVFNNSNKPVNYIKLRSKYSSTGNNLYTQEFYSGNTLTMKELRNSSVSTLEKKLKRKSGDVDFDDVDSFAGRNFNIEPGKSVPFYTFYLSKKKILGLKYDIEVLDFESTGI